ncbi:hypothetical protein H5P28_01275 [Ruficoccus amylovorans]|uniref:Uncharacterized protein n=1 Tax=Ruficoccus amylovorans TaxID=1804625 RepID=A0A842H980_9BACT|nr:hypothetical protein [Ruficoccus amylovorans]MBC2592880.1 hypothetical protein [Ruficoccus amylovorans]
MLKYFLCLLLGLGECFAAQTIAPVPVSESEVFLLERPVEGNSWTLPQVWKFTRGDNSSYADPSYNDESWRSVNAGTTIGGGGWRWYRLAFEMPPELEGKDLVLSLGAISVTDRVYVNGDNVGSYGGTPPNFVLGASDVKRRYPVPAGHFRPGRNVIAVRVYAGHKGGMYEGPYTLQPYDSSQLYAKMSLKVPGADALKTLLYDAPFAQRFEPSADVIVEPSLTSLGENPVHGVLSAEIVNASGIALQRDQIALEIDPKQWCAARFQFVAPEQEADYTCHLAYHVDGELVWEMSLPFEVGPIERITYELPVDEAIGAYMGQALPVVVNDTAMGRFSPREVDASFELYDNLSETDARSGVAYSVQIQDSLQEPRIFLANTRPTPAGGERVRKFHRVAGHRYDGLNDAWVYGKVGPAGSNTLQGLSVQASSWAKRTYRYDYSGDVWMDFSISAVSPAWVVSTNSDEIAVFDGIQTHAVGLPQYLAYEGRNGVNVVPATEGIPGEDMTANWVLAWFNGGAGWDEFDTPWLFVLEKRPTSVSTSAGTALVFSYETAAGILQGMPLYGVTLQEPARTAGWSEGLPQDVVERCQYWSRVLLNAPDQVRRSTLADFANDELIVKDEVTHLEIEDAWGTEGMKIVPVSPTLALSSKAGKIDIAADAPTRDLGMATLQGPFVAWENREIGIFRIKGLLSFIDERRGNLSLPETEEAQAVRDELNHTVAEGLQDELSKHPWSTELRHGGFIPGNLRAYYTNLLLALPYLDDPLRQAVEDEIRTETETYFLSTSEPPPELAPLVDEVYRDQPLIVEVYNPDNDLYIGLSPYGVTRFGVDQVYFGSVTVYMVWNYADTFQRYDWLWNNYETIQLLMNAPRNSHDWATGMSWDSFGGLRVGNGNQESNGIYAAMVAMVRIARQFNDAQTMQGSAYYALMAITGMQAQLYASDYLRQNRPWLHDHSRSYQIEYAQRVRGNYFTEFNEFGGMSQAIISNGNVASQPENLSGSSPGGLVENPLPEVMRLYHDLWPDFINDFYDPKYDQAINVDRRLDSRVSVDTFVYQVESYPQPVSEIFEARRDGDYNWWIRMTDRRAFLDFLSMQP